MTITKELYDIVRQQLGRFLKYNEETKLWEELDMMMARDKIGHSLRFANRRRGGSRRDRLYRKSSASIPSFSSSASSSVISAGADTATTSASTSASVSSSENSIYTASESNQTSYSWLPLNNQGEYEPTPLEDMLGKSIGDLAHSLDTVLLSDLFAPQQQADASSTNISNSKSSSNGNNDNRNNNSGSLMDLFLKSNQSDCRHSCNGYNNDNFLSSTSNHKEEEEEEEELFSPSLLWD